jgi:hypothetical protein
MNNNRQAGKSTREMAEKRRKTGIWIGVIGIVLVIIVGLLLQNSKTLVIGGMGLLVLLVLLRVLPDIFKKKVNKKSKEQQRAMRGANGEERIGELLSELSPDYHILHDIVSPYGNIDHIVISRNSGIFLIETKAHGGKVSMDGETLLVNGKLPEKDFIAQDLRNAYWLRDEVSQFIGAKPWITPILVFTNAYVSPTNPVKGVIILNKKYLLALLQRENRSNAEITRVWEQREVISKHLCA